MRLIKLFEQFISEESEMASMPVSNTVTPQTLLDNKSTAFNKVIGVKTLPNSFKGGTELSQIGVNKSEVDKVVDSLDIPMNSDDPKRLLQWIQGNGFPGIFGGSGNYGELKDRVVNEDGLWYPAVEDLRVKYNLDESFETLGSSVNSTELATVKKELLECYQYWISSINAMAIPMPSGDVSLMPTNPK